MGFNFGAAFAGFADGFTSGFEKAEKVRYSRARRAVYEQATETKKLPAEADKAGWDAVGRSRKGDGANAFDDLEVPDDNAATSDTGAAPTKPVAAPDPIPLPPKRPETFANKGGRIRGYAEGGYVDPVEQSNNEYYTQEAKRTGAIPTTPDENSPDEAEGDASNPIMGTINWLQNLGRGQGAIPGQMTAQNNPYREIFDPTGRSYPDLTQTIGGIRKVTGAPSDQPLTTSDHLTFLKARTDYIMSHGGNMTDALKFNAAYLDNLRLQSQRTFALASAAWDQGDGRAVQFFARQGWGLIPDGTSLKTAFKNGKLYVQQFDDRSGKPVGAVRAMGKDDFLRTAADVTGTTLSFGNYLADMDAQRKQKYRGTGRSSGGAGGGATARGISGKTQDQLTQAFKAAKMPGDVGEGTRMFRSLDGVGPAEVPAIYSAWRGKKLQYRDGEDAPDGDGLYDKETGKRVAGVKDKGFFIPSAKPAQPAVKPGATDDAAPTQAPAKPGNPSLNKYPTKDGSEPAPAKAVPDAPAPEANADEGGGAWKGKWNPLADIAAVRRERRAKGDEPAPEPEQPRQAIPTSSEPPTMRERVVVKRAQAELSSLQKQLENAKDEDTRAQLRARIEDERAKIDQ